MNFYSSSRRRLALITSTLTILLITLGSVLSKECNTKIGVWQYYFTRAPLPVDCGGSDNDEKREEKEPGCWGEWSAWSACNSPIICGNCGQRQRIRKCKGKEGAKCKGNDKDVATCGAKICETGSPCCSGNHLAYSTKDNFYCEADE